MDERTRARCIGTVVGLAVGDALGTTLELERPGGFTPIDHMVGGGPFSLEPGFWTDDTSMALCLAESLAECAAFGATDQMQRYLRCADRGRCVPAFCGIRRAVTRGGNVGVRARG